MLIDDGPQVARVHHLAFQQLAGHLFEYGTPVSQDIEHGFAARVDNPPHFKIDFANRFLAVDRVVRDVGAEERRTHSLAIAQAPAAEFRGLHAEFGHHAAGDVAGLLQVALSTRRRFLKDDLLCVNSAQEDANLVLQLGLHEEPPVILGPAW